MKEYRELEDKIKNCSSEKELLILEDAVSEFAKKHPEIDSDKLHFLIVNRKKHLHDHTCDPWKLRIFK